MSEISTLDELLNQFKQIETWTKDKFKLKSRIINLIKSEECYIFTGSKNLFKLSKFGDKRTVSRKELELPDKELIKYNEIEIICIGQEHCDYMFFAERKSTRSDVNKFK
jgi:hypothetical protein